MLQTDTLAYLCVFSASGACVCVCMRVCIPLCARCQLGGSRDVFSNERQGRDLLLPLQLLFLSGNCAIWLWFCWVAGRAREAAPVRRGPASSHTLTRCSALLLFAFSPAFIVFQAVVCPSPSSVLIWPAQVLESLDACVHACVGGCCLGGGRSCWQSSQLHVGGASRSLPWFACRVGALHRSFVICPHFITLLLFRVRQLGCWVKAGRADAVAAGCPPLPVRTELLFSSTAADKLSFLNTVAPGWRGLTLCTTLSCA